MLYLFCIKASFKLLWSGMGPNRSRNPLNETEVFFCYTSVKISNSPSLLRRCCWVCFLLFSFLRWLVRSMGVVIESFTWEPSSNFFVFFFISTFLSIFLFPYLAKNRTFGTFDHSVSSSFARFQRWFLAIYTLSSGNHIYISSNGSTDFICFSINLKCFRFRKIKFFLPFCRNSKWIFAVMEGLWSVYGELELTSYGLSKESMVFYLCVGYSTSLVLGPLLGVFSDLM